MSLKAELKALQTRLESGRPADVVARMKAAGMNMPLVVGGIIPPGDFDELYAAGAAAIFPPGTVIADAAIGLLKKLAERSGYALE